MFNFLMLCGGVFYGLLVDGLEMHGVIYIS